MRLVTAILAISLFSVPVFGQYAGGDGTAETPYLISTPAQLNEIGLHTEHWGSAFKLTNDIDMSAYTGTQYNIIGNSDTPFTGAFNGDGHVISNLTYITSAEINYVGLFGFVSNSQIINLGLVDVYIESAGRYLGGIMGSHSKGSLDKCYATGIVNGVGLESRYIGGLAGIANGAIGNCYAACNVSGIDYVGGLVGWHTINTPPGPMLNCYSIGVVSADPNNYRGGLVGCGGGFVINSFWDTETSGLNNSDGGNGRTTAQLKQSSNYIAWNTPTQTIWVLDEGADYPRLVWEGTPGTPLPAQILTDFIPGEGTESNPYRISTPQQLNVIGLYPGEMDKVYHLENDIDMAAYGGSDYNRIGCYEDRPFTGIFDGKGHVISNLSYSTTAGAHYVGFFGCTQNATISNLGLENVTICSAGWAVGGLIGFQHTSTTRNCYVTGNITGIGEWAKYVGGLVGYQKYGEINSCYTIGSVTTGMSTNNGLVGGLVGYQYKSAISNCYASSSAYGNHHIGGLVGSSAYSESSISNCYSTGMVTAYASCNTVGGLAGYSSGDISNCFWNTQTSGQTSGGYHVFYPDAKGLTTSQMQTLTPFTTAGWNFGGTWLLNEGFNRYPELAWQYPGDLVAPYGVDVLDLAAFGERWLDTETNPELIPRSGDWALAGGDGVVDLLDYGVLAEHWLAE